MSSFITIRLPRSRRKENAMNMGHEEGVSDAKTNDDNNIFWGAKRHKPKRSILSKRMNGFINELENRATS